MLLFFDEMRNLSSIRNRFHSLFWLINYKIIVIEKFKKLKVKIVMINEIIIDISKIKLGKIKCNLHLLNECFYIQ